MSDRSIALTTVKGGINRQRVKGAALSDSLYDLLNGYVTKARTVVNRPGTFRSQVVSATTKGLASFDGTLHVFSNVVQSVPAGYTLHVLQHPSDQTQTIAVIHFAAPFLGFLYVAAEFSGGDVYHFWLQVKGSWAASTQYDLNDVVQPTTPNGLLYKAVRVGAPAPAWASGASRALNDVIEPTEYNGFKYTVVDVIGTNPASGTVEPTWPTIEGAQIAEEVDGDPVSAEAPATGGDGPSTPSSDVIDRYGSGL
jgi:hypothetical protein